MVSNQSKARPRRIVSSLLRSASPLAVTALLLYSIPSMSIFMIGGLGKKELGAVSLANMTANITGYAVFQGLASSLDTLCSQAYGAGRKADVGLHVQRMLCLQAIALVPVALIWLFAGQLLSAVIPDPDVVRLTALYLKILLLGAPGWALAECGKRFLQAQNIFSATFFILLALAPFNAFLLWLLIYHLNLGFIGGPIAVVITQTLFPVCIALYVAFYNGHECWCGLSSRIFQDWGPMVKMSIAGFIVNIVEWLAFEVLTLAAGQIGRDELAVQGILITVETLANQVPISVGMAAAVKTGHLYGAGQWKDTKMSIIMSLLLGLAQGGLSTLVILVLIQPITNSTTSDPSTYGLMRRTLPLVAALQVLDSCSQVSTALLRAVGGQVFGSWVNFISFFGVGLPLAFTLTFKFHWGLYGLWIGPIVASLIVAIIQMTYLCKTDWRQSLQQSDTTINDPSSDPDTATSTAPLYKTPIPNSTGLPPPSPPLSSSSLLASNEDEEEEGNNERTSLLRTRTQKQGYRTSS